ncbi:hypothetical protein UFOVP132_26 [uncultured Caudovirales phage]|jgi:hypothetical protein|uniref:Uncharacterized protein n=1 Tax=uncultured Caudovirales phage TaxID=2100421 RepID=A0A6J5LDA8_9CAUD|nr:hypothetical protein UFOVP132_26 [uncultured Caudovirales phage]
MKKFRRQIESIDKFIESLEEMIDARDDMWQEEKFCNYKQAEKIRVARYEPARARLKEALTDHIVEVVEDED